MEFQQVKGQHPAPHARYLVKRGLYFFIATPCYGMHSPWWVPMTHDKELEPIDIEPTDKWIPLKAVIE